MSLDMDRNRTNRIQQLIIAITSEPVLTYPIPKANFELKPTLPTTLLELFFRNFNDKWHPIAYLSNLSLNAARLRDLRQRNACDYACLGRMATLSHSAEEYLKYGPTIKTCNTFDNRKKSIVDKPAAYRTRSISFTLHHKPAIRITNLISCRGHQVLTRGRKTTKTSHCCQSSIFVLFFSTSWRRIDTWSIPRSSSTPTYLYQRTTYDQNTIIGLDNKIPIGKTTALVVLHTKIASISPQIHTSQ